ncbi:hypothetical protein N7470_010416 [Penicillium chermesinum]|nr:hypothetical protein N7470_010416 [Penicillium chermesinum]
MTVFLGVYGYVTNYFSTKKLGANQVATCIPLDTSTIGLLANPAPVPSGMFMQLQLSSRDATLVPSGITSSGSIISGLS